MKKTFQQMSAAEKRVAIAKDVIEQVKTSGYIPVTSTYVSVADLSVADLSKPLTKIKHCECCAVGSVFVSTLRLRGDKKTSYLNNPYDNHDLIYKYFGVEQGDMIEEAFEGWHAGYEFYLNYDNDRDRLIAIMENIIKNKGSFIP